MATERSSEVEPIPSNAELIQIHLSEPMQMFNSVDPSPFHERDLDSNAEDFIVSWARELRRDAPLTLLVHLDRPAGLLEGPSILGNAVRGFFSRRAQASRRNVRQLFRRGRVSLLIGLVFLAVSIGVGEVVETSMAGRRLGLILRESLLIGGWVAMWRPLEIFLYDWWPILAEARLYDRLSAMHVRIG